MLCIVWSSVLSISGKNEKIEKIQVFALFIEKNMKISFKCEKTKISTLQNFRFWSTRSTMSLNLNDLIKRKELSRNFILILEIGVLKKLTHELIIVLMRGVESLEISGLREVGLLP